MAQLPKDFRDHQRQIRAILDEAQPYLQSDCDDGLELCALRPRLQHALTEYQRYKHNDIFDPAVAAGGEGAMLAQDLKIECIALGAEYESFGRAWPTQRVSDDWQAYQTEARSMFTTLQAGLSAEASQVLNLMDLWGSRSGHQPNCNI